jgi:hypothetical protein
MDMNFHFPLKILIASPWVIPISGFLHFAHEVHIT